MVKPRSNEIWTKYNHLTVIDHAKDRWYKRYVICKCECGNIKEIWLSHLRSWWTTSCGCKSSRLVVGDRSRTHWFAWTRIYKIYMGMKDRCENQDTPAYKDYWARWIQVERKTFEDFFADMFPTYKEWLTIDRYPNNDWNYCKENCRWSTRREQTKNRRTTIRKDWMCLKDYCKINNLVYWKEWARNKKVLLLNKL